ncbi:hypothetical protein N9C54_03695 [Acidimicrobiia bacterium]|nr:hypothetical protein [Candidatus Actinomarina sp.]MDA9845013.1 hypothetical protein [Acidimicrobiia bacterium]MDC3275340.1 hypothetical protein [bacterium]MDB3891446.1 hypothetical protein [Acidimicrobiia bacterium]MDB3980536.1 hypothetical protein [Acidimicrobiia bacterium]|tara:strand:+ start:928 stop:1569 length:642 start_codon:yes stop_codon:yes gene_type:complete
MFINNFLIKKELLNEYRNNTSLFLITPTIAVLVLVFPILSENRFVIDDDFFIINQLLFLLFFSTLFSIRNPLNQAKLRRELNFANIERHYFFRYKTISEFIIYFPQALILLALFSVFTNTGIKSNPIYFVLSIVFFSLNSIMINIIFQMFTAFSNRFVQFILIVPVFMSLSFFVAPIWLGINPNLTNIYLMMYLGITLLVSAYTNWILQKDLN